MQVRLGRRARACAVGLWLLAAPAVAGPWPVDRGGRLMVPTGPRALMLEVDDAQRQAIMEPFSPFAPGGMVVVEGPDGPRSPAPSTVTYYRGRFVDDPASFVFAAVDRAGDRVGGFALSRGRLASLGPPRAGLDRIPPGRSLEGDVRRPPAAFRASRVPVASVTLPAMAPLAIETDHELWAKFGNDEEARDYVAAVIAAASAIYQRDVGVRLSIGYLRLWATTVDPWASGDTGATLDEVQAYWTDPAHGLGGVPRATVHMMSGKPVTGGIAYLGVLCSTTYGYGVSQVEGAFDLSSPAAIWDVMVVAHELGHNFGSPHEHCIQSGGQWLDRCYGQEPGCYSGPRVCSRGATMSYCHLCPGGLSNIDLLFLGPVVGDFLREISSVSCLVPDTTPTTTTVATTTQPTTTHVSTTVQPTTTRPTTTLGPVTSTTTTVSPSTTTTTLACKGSGKRCMQKRGCCSRRCVRERWWQVRGVCG